MSLENCTGYPEMPKDSSECVKLLRQFNAWRRFDGEIDEEGPAMPHPKSIGFAIDMAIRLIEERGELLAALEHFATWGRGQHRAQSKGCHSTFDMMMLNDEIDFAEHAIASAKGCA